MSEKLKGLVKTARAEVKSDGKMVDGKVEKNNFGDATGHGLFSEVSQYDPSMDDVGWNGKFPEKNKVYYDNLAEIVNENKGYEEDS